MYTSELASNIPDGFSAVCYNLVATGDSLENRIGIRRSTVNHQSLYNAPTTVARANDIDSHGYFCQIDPWGGDSSKAAFAWSSQGSTVPGNVLNSSTLNFVRAAGAVDANDGFMAVTTAGLISGICQYNGTIYYSQITAPVGV